MAWRRSGVLAYHTIACAGRQAKLGVGLYSRLVDSMWLQPAAMQHSFDSVRLLRRVQLRERRKQEHHMQTPATQVHDVWSR